LTRIHRLFTAAGLPTRQSTAPKNPTVKI